MESTPGCYSGWTGDPKRYIHVLEPGTSNLILKKDLCKYN